MDLQKSKVTLDRWSKDLIKHLKYSVIGFWETNGIGQHHHNPLVKQMILIIHFLAGPRFEALALSSDRQSYKHFCANEIFLLSTPQDMVYHVETHHHHRDMARPSLEIDHFHWKLETLYLSVPSYTLDLSYLTDCYFFCVTSFPMFTCRIRSERSRNSGLHPARNCMID